MAPETQDWKNEPAPQTAIIAGSESDRPIIDASEMLIMAKEMTITYELSYLSAHRHPEELREYCRHRAKNGTLVFIGTASMQAALAGAIAAATEAQCPVIGVPLIASDNFMGGLDALLSMVRMPSPIPVNVPGVGKVGLKLAIIAAAQIIALVDQEVRTNLQVYLVKNWKDPKYRADYYKK